MRMEGGEKWEVKRERERERVKERGSGEDVDNEKEGYLVPT